MTTDITAENQIALFEGIEIRKIIHNNEWWFSIEDIIEILTESSDPKQYIKKMRGRDKELGSNWGTICTPLAMIAKDGKRRNITASNTEGVLRIIQSIPSPKAEPFKRWLAKVGYERIQEIEDPELSMKRMIETYEKKGYPQEWIDIRTRGIPVRKGLTKERDQRGGEKAYGILTNEVYKAYSGMTNEERKIHKGMKGNLRDGMTPTELILTMLAEQATTDITQAREAQGLKALKKASKDGGGVASKARKELIEQSGIDPITDKNYLQEIKNNKITKKK
ncbi:MAG: Bro-N domain-containing protein [Candidatus Absconditabacteria bacterium]